MKKNFNKIIFFILFFILFSCQVSYAIEFKRKILGLYKSSEADLRSNMISTFFETTINYLGCTIEYHAIEDGLPDDNFMQDFQGVITFFYGSSMKNAKDYCLWLKNQIANNKKVVIFSNFGAFIETRDNSLVDTRLIDSIFHALGLDILYEETEDKNKIEIVFKDKNILDFEKRLTSEDLTYYIKIRSLDPQNRVFLKIRRKDKANSESDLITIGPTGGICYGNYILYQNPKDFKTQFFINPIKFLQEALDLNETPRLDIAILNGMRIFFSHIDGDGFNSTSRVNPKKVCAQILLEEVLKRYDLPVSCSVIVADVEKNKSLQDLSRKIFNLKNVEVASHSFYHPFDWERQIYMAGQNKNRIKFNLEKELIDSIGYINQNLAPLNKKTKIFFWTGCCNPTKEQIAILEKEGMRNFNSGFFLGGRFDEEFPSLSNIGPAATLLGNQIQFNSRIANDYLYTNSFTHPLDGFKKVIQTFSNADKELTLTPIEVYYHWYSGIDFRSLNALREIYEWALKQEIAPLFTSEYVDLLKDFLNAKIYQEKNSWRIENKGFCRTVRFDNCLDNIDLEKSQNILGFLHNANNLYVFLDEHKTHIIYLSKDIPQKAYLKKAGCYIENWQEINGKVSFLAKGYGQLNFSVGGLKKQTFYQIKIISGIPFNIVTKTDLKGELNFNTKILEEAKIKIQQTGVTNFLLEELKKIILPIFIFIFILLVLRRQNK